MATWSGHSAPARIEMIGGRKHLYWDITGTNVGVNDEVEFSAPRFLTQRLLHVIRSTPGASSTTAPKVGTASSFTADGIDDQKTYSAAAVQRQQEPLAIVARNSKVVIQVKPDATVDEVRIVYAAVEGHDEV
jgi:hypothetical protein